MSDTFQCESCKTIVSRVVDCDGEKLCTDCADNGCYSPCPNCSKYTHESDMLFDPNSELLCNDCHDDLVGSCGCCGIEDWNDNLFIRRFDTVCAGCNTGRETYDPTGFFGRELYEKITSRRCYGLEIETSVSDNHKYLDGEPAWGAKDDCTVTGKEMVSGVLHGDDGLKAVDRLCGFAAENGWDVDSDCGFHAHFDMRGEDLEGLRSIALAYLLTYDVWSRFVDTERRQCYYCQPHKVGINQVWDCVDFNRLAARLDRYSWFNIASYYNHKTFEIRLHGGTLNGTEIKNWVRAHTAFIDWASAVGWKKVRNTLLAMDSEEKMDFVASIWEDAGYDDLRDYYSEKVRQNTVSV